MSFYEVAGDYKAPQPTVTSKIPRFYGEHSSEKNRQMREFASGTKLPYEALEIISNYISGRVNETAYKHSRDVNYKASLAYSVVIQDANKAIEMFTKLNRLGSLTIKDIYALEYSIFAFNDGENHWIRLSKGVEKFNQYDSSLYHMHLCLNIDGIKYDFGINLSTIFTKAPNASHSKETREALITKWFPEYDKFFYKKIDRSKLEIVQDFIAKCRASVGANK